MKYCCEDISRIENYELAKKDDFKGWACHHRLETHTSEGNLKVEKYIVGVSMRDLFNGLKAKSDAGNFNVDCSNDLVFRKKARAGRDVKLTNNETNVALYARIRELKNL